MIDLLSLMGYISNREWLTLNNDKGINMITKENIEQIEQDYDCHSVKVENYYITVIEYEAKNPENQGERIDLMTVGQFEEMLDEDDLEDSGHFDPYIEFGVSHSDFI